MSSFCKPRLSWEVAQGSLLTEGNWGGEVAVHAVFSPVRVAQQPFSIASSTTYFICLVMPRGGLPGVVVAGTRQLWGLRAGLGAPRVLPVLFFVALPGSCSSARDQGSFQTECSTQGL